MRISRLNADLVLFALMSAMAFFPSNVLGQDYPSKPITIYCGFAAGATTDLTARALASGAEKLLGVPVAVESKAGGGATVCAGLVASKKPDGYTLGVISTAALALRPHLLKLAYDPLKDFTLLMQYSRYIGALCVLSKSPIKTIDQFIAYSKANPGLSYSSTGMFTGQQMAIEVMAECKGLKFKHIPTKGGAEANTLLIGEHVDFVAGGGQHISYAKQGVFRMLVLVQADKRDPNFPDVPTLKELGCGDIPIHGYIVVGPRGMPDAVCRKLGSVFKEVVEAPEFQKLLVNYDLPYDYKDQKQLEMNLPIEHEIHRVLLEKMGFKK